MTVSRVSGSNAFQTQLQTSPQIENADHAWVLSDENIAYLFCDNDELKCLFVKGDGRFTVSVPFSDSLTAEEARDDLLERYYPVLEGNDTIRFVEYEKEPPTSDIHDQNFMSAMRPGISFRNILSGEKAFYNQPDYVEAGTQELSSNQCMPVSYTWNTEYKTIRIAKGILPILILSIGVYKFFCILAGKASLKQPLLVPVLSIIAYKILQVFSGTFILPATALNQKDLDAIRLGISLRGPWKYKRIAIKVDGCKIDGAIVGKPFTLGNGRWLLASNGNSTSYEHKLRDEEFKQILHKCNSNALVFNYPTVGSSSGPLSKQTIVKAYRAMLTFLEDKEKGIGAQEIIGYGKSIGGGVQGEALKTHPLKKEVKYVFIKDRTFSTLTQIISQMKGRFLGLTAKCLGWEMDSITSSKKLQAPEIILQTTKKNHLHLLENVDDLRETDLVIEKESSLAFALLKREIHQNKYYLGITSTHSFRLGKEVIESLSAIVNQSLAKKALK
jgi:hypothetical protein